MDKGAAKVWQEAFYHASKREKEKHEEAMKKLNSYFKDIMSA